MPGECRFPQPDSLPMPFAVARVGFSPGSRENFDGAGFYLPPFPTPEASESGAPPSPGEGIGIRHGPRDSRRPSQRRSGGTPSGGTPSGGTSPPRRDIFRMRRFRRDTTRRAVSTERWPDGRVAENEAVITHPRHASRSGRSYMTPSPGDGFRILRRVRES